MKNQLVKTQIMQVDTLNETQTEITSPNYSRCKLSTVFVQQFRKKILEDNVPITIHIESYEIPFIFEMLVPSPLMDLSNTFCLQYQSLLNPYDLMGIAKVDLSIELFNPTHFKIIAHPTIKTITETPLFIAFTFETS